MNESPGLQRLSGHVEGLMKAESAALDAVRNVASSADEYVRENPWIAIGVIAGVAASLGFLAGYMTAPRGSLMSMWRR